MKRRGFTMIELVVVVSILAVLVAMVFPVYSAIRRSQKIKRVEATLVTLATGIEAYQNDFGLLPPANPPPGLVKAGSNLGNRSLVVFLRLGDAAPGKSAPYLPSRFYQINNGLLQIGGGAQGYALLDEWDHPYIYFDTAAMRSDLPPQTYAILGNPAVLPAQGPTTGYYNLGRYQLWSCGPNGRNDGGRNLHTADADDIANFVTE